MIKIYLILQLILIFTPNIQNEPCTSAETCGQCITIDPDCGWCTDEKFQLPRCRPLNELLSSGCPNKSVEYPINGMKIVFNQKLSRDKVASEKEAIQIQPQRISLALRPHLIESFEMFYRQAVDYPVDLYYLMDLSRTMANHKKTLASLGNKLAESMRRITKNFRIGFGSFIDKSVLPFADTNPKKLRNPCSDCSRPYGFKHSMSLDTDTSRFIRQVESSPISGNIDGPEGGLDAILQAIVCQKEIGWRRDARHLLVYTTDASYHYAGDGRLAGIIKPNDEKCHLDSDGYYTEGANQDYPSMNQINMVSQENNVHIIFAIAGDRLSSYDNLIKKVISSSPAKLTSNSSNIVQIIKNEYTKITSNIQLSDNSSDHLRLTYYSSCLGQRGSDLRATRVCEGLTVDSQVMFQVDIELISCPVNPAKRREIVKINPIGLEEGLILEINMICDCDCESPEKQVTSAPQCNRKGTFACGICVCKEGSFGKRCECDASDARSVDDEQCYRNKTDTKPCLGRGNCICGQCSCFPIKGHSYSGEYCQCDDLACDYYQDQLCGGHGSCKCGRCACFEPWAGPACECNKSNFTCTDPINGKICNGRGTCDCGICQCDDTKYTGRYCDVCSSCNECHLYKDIVEGQVSSGLDILVQENNFTSVLVDELSSEPGDVVCPFNGTNGCVYSFSYRYTPSMLISDSATKVIIKANRRAQCGVALNLKAYAFEYIGTVVIIGVATLLLWRLITFLLDRHEYEKFKKACANVDFPENQNPLFKPSTSTFTNPTFNE